MTSLADQLTQVSLIDSTIVSLENAQQRCGMIPNTTRTNDGAGRLSSTVLLPATRFNRTSLCPIEGQDDDDDVVVVVCRRFALDDDAGRGKVESSPKKRALTWYKLCRNLHN